MPFRIQIRRGTAAQWNQANTILSEGEIGYESDTKKIKIGDGSTAWTALDYGITGEFPDDSVTTAKLQASSVTETNIATAAVTAGKIGSGAVTEDKIGTGAVTAGKIANDAVTQAKLADRVIGSSEYDNMTLNAQTGTSYTLLLSDAHKLVTLSNASAITLTIPTNAVAAFEIGDQVNILQLGAGQVTIGGAGVTIRSYSSKLKLIGQYAGATLIKIGTDEWVVVGNTAA